MEESHRIIFNTGITYLRAILTAGISLYATRVVLGALGANDFGLFNVIGGLIAFLAFISASMTSATQRFLSYSFGQNDNDKVKEIFSNSILLHFLIGIILVIIIEILGLYAINFKMKIEPDRLLVAEYLLHFAALSTFITVIGVPYDALINAHENMLFLAKINVFETVLKLLIALSLSLISYDKLMVYGFLTMITAFLVRFIKKKYCERKYIQGKFKSYEGYNIDCLKELGSFAGWQLFGSLSAVGKNQGVAVVISFFFTSVVNAGYGIANQLNSQMMFFSQTIMNAIRPQLVKSEGKGDRQRAISLTLSANKFSFFLFAIFSIPLFFYIDVFLRFWLKDVPEYTVQFSQAIIILTLVNQVNIGVNNFFQAIGKIKVYQICVGILQLAVLPLGYVFFKLGFQPYFIIVISVILEVFVTVFRVFYFNSFTNYPKIKYFKKVIMVSLLTSFPSVIFTFFCVRVLDKSIISLLSVSFLSGVIFLISIYFIGFDADEKIAFHNLINTVKRKFLPNTQND